jgi:hypothetical protein
MPLKAISRKILPSLVLAMAALSLMASCRTAPAKADASSGASPAGKAAEVPRPPLLLSGEQSPDIAGKRTLVVYFTQGSATRQVAEDLAAIFGARIERIVEKKSRVGIFGFIGAGADSSVGASTPIQTPVLDPASFDRVIVCTPVWAWRLAPPVRTWLSLMRGRLPDCAYVVVSGNTAPAKIIPMMVKASGKEPRAIAGFVQDDFEAGKTSVYAGKIRELVGKML